jgi:hypothetical protein
MRIAEWGKKIRKFATANPSVPWRTRRMEPAGMRAT